jgi:hypothetical protein
MVNYGGVISAGETPDSSTRALWQCYQQSHIVANKDELGEGNDEFGQTKYFCSYFQVIFISSKILRHRTDGFTSPPKEVVLRIFIALKNRSSSAGFEPANLGSNGKHANHETSEATK